MNGLASWMRQRRALWATGFDISAWVLAFVLFAWLRMDLDSSVVPWTGVLVLSGATAVGYALVSWPTRLHQGRARTGSLEEMLLLGACVVGVGVVVFTVNLLFQWVPRSIPAGATVTTLVAAAWARATWRSLREREAMPEGRADGTPVLLIGAGEGGHELVGSMLRDPARTWRPVGFLDDDRLKRHRRIARVPVLGATDQVEHFVGVTGAEAVIVAIPSATRELISRLRGQALAAGVPIKVLPPSTQILSEEVGIRDLRDIDFTDLLGRNQLDTDVDSIAAYLDGRRVMITGAGGSIGSELCRQIHGYRPAELIMLDRDESALHALQLSIHGRAPFDDDVVLCDIRDRQALNTLFKERRPEVVFHAAALKHLPMLEQYPAEAVKTNVIGTQNVLDAAELVGVNRFVNISTDKAANPQSILGYSKRVSERLTAARAAQTGGGSYLSVRFGNVLGSRGSVLTCFATQIATGGPLTITHPEVTRFFMTIEEACQLVIQAGAIGQPGEVLVLDMGFPVRIEDMARQLIAQDGRPVRIEYTGLGPGEKLHEELFGEGEPRNIRPAHPMVSHVPVPPIDEDEVFALHREGHDDMVRQKLAQLSLCGSFPANPQG